MDEFEDIVYLDNNAVEAELPLYSGLITISEKVTPKKYREMINEPDIQLRDKYIKRTLEHSRKFDSLIQELDPLFKSLDVLNPPAMFHNQSSKKIRPL